MRSGYPSAELFPEAIFGDAAQAALSDSVLADGSVHFADELPNLPPGIGAVLAAASAGVT